MKILPVDKIREADAYTIAHEPIEDIDLMERASSACFSWIFQNVPVNKPIKVFAGSGNNGGDGLAVARLLALQGYQVTLYMIADPDKLSPGCRINYQRLPASVTLILTDKPDFDIPLSTHDVIIDALLGSGLDRPVTGLYAKVIHHINQSGALIIAIDVPSGLYIDKSVFLEKNPVVIQADYTLTFSPPKLAFMFPENDRFVGQWIMIDIGIMQRFIDQVDVKNFLVKASDIKPLLHRRHKFDHKGIHGHALLICGESGKMGAAVLAAKACLRTGVGLVTVRIPKSGVNILQTAVPEAMALMDPNETMFTEVPDLTPYTGIGVGSGIGQSPGTAKGLKLLIQTGQPLVIDADAINILGENKTWLGFLPPGCIFTPHIKEFERLIGKSDTDFERNRIQREFSIKYSCYVVLKGAFTAITTPDGSCYFNSTGNPGMATAGSGDVLTGIIPGFRAQGYTALESCLLGVFLHGSAGDLAADEKGMEAMIASDIINHISSAFKSVYGEF